MRTNGKHIISMSFAVLVTALGCTPREEVSSAPTSQALRLQSDTLLFDTVFTNQLSITKRTQVYNTLPNAIQIDEISVAGGENSPFSLIINGTKTHRATNVFLRGRDSILVLANVTLNRNTKTLPFLVTDSIFVRTAVQTKKIYLVAWGQNAYYYNGDTLQASTVWDSTKAHFIYKTVYVPHNVTLTIEKGSKVHSVRGAGIVVDGLLKVYGDTAKPVIFQGPRLDAFFRNVPGQWQGIWLRNTHAAHILTNCVIKNATNGIIIGDTVYNNSTQTTTIQGCELANMAAVGLKIQNTDAVIYNSVFTNVATHALWVAQSSRIKAWNNTFVLTPTVFTRLGSAVNIENGYLQAEIINNCIWGDLNNELTVSVTDALVLQNNLIKTNVLALRGDTNSIFNQNPRLGAGFKPDSLSPLIGRAKVLPYFTTDKNGLVRGSKWDIGAVQRMYAE